MSDPVTLYDKDGKEVVFTSLAMAYQAIADGEMTRQPPSPETDIPVIDLPAERPGVAENIPAQPRRGRKGDL